MKNEQFIKSFVRLKPIMFDQSPVIGFNKREIVINKTKEIYSFNEVFNDSSQNDYIYDKSILPLMSDLFNGYSACILAYGQTSSGKTYTMKGVSQNLGLIPLSIKEIFKRITNYQMFAKVSISYFQIYNQNLIDLLNQEEQVRYLQLREDGKKNLVVVDLIEQEVKDEFQALSFYEKGQMKRKFASNNVNFASSRSHTIFKIILSVVTQSHQLVESSIYMVDLAGSESISKTNAVGVLKKQSENINKSLLALTTAIRAISQKQTYINYRNSKLTRILQPCLCGNSKTIVICTVKQTDECLSETLNTLKFGVCANSIRTDVKQNVIEVPLEGDENSRYRSLIQILDEQRNDKAKLQIELNAKTNQLYSNKIITSNLAAELQECKHKLFALENQNSHHNGLIQYYKAEKQKELINKNIFYQKSQQSITLIENQNKNLKMTISNLNENMEKRNKKIAILEKNQRVLLDRIQKYQKELSRLQQMLTQQQKKSKLQDSRKIVEVNLRNSSKSNDLVGNQTKNKKEKMTFYDIGRYSPPESGQLSHPFTIGTVISLSTTILSMKIDMNHYLNAITDLHTEIYTLQDKIDQITKNTEEKIQVPRQSGKHRESGFRSKQDDKKMRKLEKRSQQLKKQNQKLKKKNVHYLKILKKCANNNIESITGFNEYIEKNFKINQKALFQQLMQQNAEDYEPYTSTDNENINHNKKLKNNNQQQGGAESNRYIR